MVNKKAWLRITEASIAILIVLSAMLIIMSKQNTTTNINQEIQEKQSKILDTLISNDETRTQILNQELEPIKEKISKLIQSNWEFAINICEIDSSCSNPLPIYDKNVYTSERLIITTPTNYSPKKIRFFVWIKDY